MTTGLNQVFKDIDNLLKETETVFREMDKVMEQAAEVMRKAGEVARKQEIGPWKPWFAWRPVKVNGKKVWMKKVYRRCINTYVDHDDWRRYQYGDMFDVLRDAE